MYDIDSFFVTFLKTNTSLSSLQCEKNYNDIYIHAKNHSSLGNIIKRCFTWQNFSLWVGFFLLFLLNLLKRTSGATEITVVFCGKIKRLTYRTIRIHRSPKAITNNFVSYSSSSTAQRETSAWSYIDGKIHNGLNIRLPSDYFYYVLPTCLGTYISLWHNYTGEMEEMNYTHLIRF